MKSRGPERWLAHNRGSKLLLNGEKKEKEEEGKEGREEKERSLRELTPYVKPCAMYDKDNFILGGGVGFVGDPVRPFSYADDPEKGEGGSLHSTDLFIFIIYFYYF